MSCIGTRKVHRVQRGKPIKVRNCNKCEVVTYCILITTRIATMGKTRNEFLKNTTFLFVGIGTIKILLVRSGLSFKMKI